jgi:hypothetical protein
VWSSVLIDVVSNVYIGNGVENVIDILPTSIYGILQQSTASYGILRHITAFYGIYGILRQPTAFYGSLRHFTALYGILRHSTAFSGSLRHSTACLRHSTASYGTSTASARLPLRSLPFVSIWLLLLLFTIMMEKQRICNPWSHWFTLLNIVRIGLGEL